MKLLVLAQTPPPLHGQSVMVQTLLDGLAGQPELELHHVNLPLSRNAADIGRIRPGKIRPLLNACRQARRLAAANRISTLYYVPSPGKRSALYRDWIAMALCRPAFRRLVLHWHAPGLGIWLKMSARSPERLVTRRLLGRADLSIVLAECLRADAEALEPKQIAVVSNGIVDPCPGWVRVPPTSGPFRVLFLGLCSEEKGLFAAANAVVEANRLTGGAAAPAFAFTAAGAFADDATKARLERLIAAHPGILRHVGMVTGEQKRALFTSSDLLCMPTCYPHEGQPLVLLEAMAYDLPIVATRWRAIPETVPPEMGVLVGEPGPTALAQALIALRAKPPPVGVCRKYFLCHFTREQHWTALRAALARIA